MKFFNFFMFRNKCFNRYVETLKIFGKVKAEKVEQGTFELKKKSTFDLEDNADDDEDD